MIRREAARTRILAHVGKPQALTFAQKHGQKTVAFRNVADPRALGVADTTRHELLDASVSVEHTQRCIARIDLTARDLYELLKDDFQRQFRGERDSRLHQSPDLFDCIGLPHYL